MTRLIWPSKTIFTTAVAEAAFIAPVGCAQNSDHFASQGDDLLIDDLATRGTGDVPSCPIGGSSALQTDTLIAVARRNGASNLAVALAWTLQRTSNILLNLGTSWWAHLREKVTGSAVAPSENDLEVRNAAASE